MKTDLIFSGTNIHKAEMTIRASLGKENTEKYIKHLSLNKIDSHNTLNTGLQSMTQLCRAVQTKT